MKNIFKLSALFVAGAVLMVGLPKQAEAQVGVYSCVGTYGYIYGNCSTNNTANQSSTVATAATVLRTAASQSSRLISSRVSNALDGNSGFNMASNGFSASTGMSAGDGWRGKTGLWVAGSFASVEDNNTDTAFDGEVYNGFAGVDYKIAPNTVIGISLGYESSDIDTEYNGTATQDGNVEGDGYTIAPYVGVSITDKISADLMAGYSDLEYDTLRFDPVSGTRITGSTDAERYFVSGGVNGQHRFYENWRLRGRASIFYANEEKDAFTETYTGGTTVAVADQETELGQALLDARLGYMFSHVEPYALVGAEFDFAKDEGEVAVGQTPSNDDDFGAKFGGGVNFQITPNFSGGVEAYTVEFRDDYDEYAVTGGLRARF